MKKTIILTDGIIKKYICSLREQERNIMDKDTKGRPRNGGC